MSNCLVMIWNYDHVLKQNAKFDKIYELKKFTFVKIWLTQNMWHIGAIVNITNNKLQNISFENSFLWNRCYMAKRPQRTIIFNPKETHWVVKSCLDLYGQCLKNTSFVRWKWLNSSYGSKYVKSHVK